MKQSAERLRISLEQALVTTAMDDVELRDAVNSFVDAHRKAASPPERVVIEIKDLARSVARQRFSEGKRGVEDSESRVTERVIQWAIQRYYSGSAG